MADTVENKPKVSPEVVQDTARKVNKHNLDLQETRGEMSGVYGSFEEKGGNKAAFRASVAIMRMDSTKAQQYVRDLLYYLECQGFQDQLDMLDKVPGPEDAPAPAEAPDDKQDDGGAAAEPEPAEAAQQDDAAEAASDTIDLTAIEEAGGRACESGKKQTDNPYDPDEEPESYEAWNDGFVVALNQGRAPEPTEDAEAA